MSSTSSPHPRTQLTAVTNTHQQNTTQSSKHMGHNSTATNTTWTNVSRNTQPAAPLTSLACTYYILTGHNSYTHHPHLQIPTYQVYTTYLYSLGSGPGDWTQNSGTGDLELECNHVSVALVGSSDSSLGPSTPKAVKTDQTCKEGYSGDTRVSTRVRS